MFYSLYNICYAIMTYVYQVHYTTFSRRINTSWRHVTNEDFNSSQIFVGTNNLVGKNKSRSRQSAQYYFNIVIILFSIKLPV